MRSSKIKKMIAGFWALTVAVTSCMTALAADTVDVTGSGRYASETHTVVGYGDQDLFSDMKERMPGDVVSNNVTIANKSNRAVTIYMRAYPDFSSADGITAVRDGSSASAVDKTFRGDILDQISMTLKLGEQVIYQGSADGQKPEAESAAMTDPDYGLKLGSFAAGAQQTLEVMLELPGPIFDNTFADSFDAVDWVFYVEGSTPSSGGGGGGGGGGGTTGHRAVSTVSTDSGMPLGPWTGQEEGPNIVIADSGTPLAGIPRLGDTGVSGGVFGILLALLAACTALYTKKRLSRS